MKTVQVSRRGANKRTLIAGIALGAVVALSYVESAMAAWASCTGANGAEINTVNNPDTTGSTDACKCVEGYAEAVSTDSPTYVGGTTLNCKFCAEGYYLSSIGGEPADHVCSQVSDKVHTGPPTADLTAYASLQAPTSGSNDDCAADHYGVATGFDGTGCDACPFGGSSDAGSGDLVYCTPDCSDAAFAVDGSTGNCHCAAGYYGTADGTTTDGTGCDACPFGGTTLTAGSSALTDCAPDCATTNTNSGAVANGGTCECAANYYGSPLDAGGVTTAAASTGCTACSAGTTSTAGTTASSGCTGASPTAASPTAADSAGASTPIAVALAAAAAVPLLL